LQNFVVPDVPWQLWDGTKKHYVHFVYVYVSEDRAIKYKMTVEQVDEPYDHWMAKEEEFWVDKGRITDESQTKYALLRLVKESRSGKLTEENLMKHGFLRAPQGVKYLEGALLKFIERRF